MSLMKLSGFDGFLLALAVKVPDDKILVSKETVVLRLWESETGKFGFMKHVDKDRITTLNNLECLRFEG